MNVRHATVSAGGEERKVDNRARGKGIASLVYVLSGLVVALALVVVYLFATGQQESESGHERAISEPAQSDGREIAASELAPSSRSGGPDAAEIERRKRSLHRGFEEILRKNPNEKYIITDLNENGFPELWISYYVGNHADGRIHLYHSSKGVAVEFASIPGGSLYIRGNYVVAEHERNGYAYQVRYSYDGSRLHGEETEYGVSLPDKDDQLPTTRMGAIHSAFE